MFSRTKSTACVISSTSVVEELEEVLFVSTPDDDDEVSLLFVFFQFASSII